MKIYINKLVQEQSLTEALTYRLEQAAELLMQEYKLVNGEVGIILADDRCLRELNRAYRGLDEPTDVLAFGYLDPEDPAWAAAPCSEEEMPVGDIYISLDRAREQALESGHHLHREILLLAVHGILHLIGFDHADSEERASMQEKEAQVLGRIE